jgi:hypothetical protein
MPERLSERLPCEIDDCLAPRLVTVDAGGPLVIELRRRMGAAPVITEPVRSNRRQRGLPPAQIVETPIALWTAGAERCQDSTTLRRMSPWRRCGATSCRRGTSEWNRSSEA